MCSVILCKFWPYCVLCLSKYIKCFNKRTISFLFFLNPYLPNDTRTSALVVRVGVKTVGQLVKPERRSVILVIV